MTNEEIKLEILKLAVSNTPLQEDQLKLYNTWCAAVLDGPKMGQVWGNYQPTITEHTITYSTPIPAKKAKKILKKFKKPKPE